MTRLNLRNSVFIDCTADAKVALTYKDALEKYVSVVTASKIACSSEYSYYHTLKSLASDKRCPVYVRNYCRGRITDH